VLRRREGTCFSSPSDDEVGALKGAIRAERAKRAEQSNMAGVVELVDTQDLGSCAFGCEGSSPSFGTVFIDSAPTRSPHPIRLVCHVW
jgi:hypothetical protein